MTRQPRPTVRALKQAASDIERAQDNLRAEQGLSRARAEALGGTLTRIAALEAERDAARAEAGRFRELLDRVWAYMRFEDRRAVDEETQQAVFAALAASGEQQP